MTDQGWMVDDGTCDECLEGECWRCPDTHEEAGGDGDVLVLCCCNEQYVVSRQAPGELVGVIFEPQGGDDHDRRD